MLPLWIFSEGDPKRGLGHLSRCSAYAAAWRQQGGAVQWVVDGDDAAAIMLQGERVTWSAWQQQEVDHNEAVAIVDSYSASATTLKSIADHFERVLYLDDTERLDYPKGLVIHAAPGEAKVKSGEAQWLWGPSWQPLRTAFWSIPPRTHFPPSITKILVIMGGTDIRQLTPKLVSWLHTHYPEVSIETVVQHPLPTLSHCTQHHHLNAEQMAELMCQCDLAISSAGQVTYELARCGLPGILIGAADNQAAQLQGWCEGGGFIYGGWWHDSHLLTRLSQALCELTSANSRAERAHRLQHQMAENGALKAVAWLAQR